jgi:hypothetical protein
MLSAVDCSWALTRWFRQAHTEARKNAISPTMLDSTSPEPMGLKDICLFSLRKRKLCLRKWTFIAVDLLGFYRYPHQRKRAAYPVIYGLVGV